MTDYNNIMKEVSLIYGEKSKNNQFDLLFGISSDTIDLIKFQLNKLIVTNLSTKKIGKSVELIDSDIKSLADLLNYLETQSTGKDIDVGIIQEYARSESNGNEDVYNFILQIASKSVPLRIGIPTMNKFLIKQNKQTIPDFSVQLSNNIDKLKQKDIDKLNNIYVTEKLDGVRTIAMWSSDDNSFKLFSRSGKEFTGFDDILNDLNNLDKNFVYDGEMLIKEGSEKAEDSFRETMKIIGADNSDRSLVAFNIFDVIDNDGFSIGESKLSYKDRRDIIDSLPTTDNILTVPVLLVANDFEEIKDKFNELVSGGAEGVMLNKADSKYLSKRHNGILKYKQVYDSEGIVQGVFEGSGEATGKLGGIIVNYKETTVRIGTGFTDQQRTEYWNNPDLIIGKLAQYRYTSVSHNQNNDEVSLRFARFISLREDKNEESFDN